LEYQIGTNAALDSARVGCGMFSLLLVWPLLFFVTSSRVLLVELFGSVCSRVVICARRFVHYSPFLFTLRASWDVEVCGLVRLYRSN
jgi:hypothetical protein